MVAVLSVLSVLAFGAVLAAATVAAYRLGRRKTKAETDAELGAVRLAVQGLRAEVDRTCDLLTQREALNAETAQLNSQLLRLSEQQGPAILASRRDLVDDARPE